jgi:lysozyme
MSKRLFGTIRRLLGRGLTQSEVDAINASMRPDAPSVPELPITPGEIGEAGLVLIQSFEGCHRVRADKMVEAYPDPGTGGVPWTIGWGATGPGIAKGTIWTQKQCDDRLDADLVKYAAEVKQALGPALARTSQSQFDALVSFHYNTGAIGRATLTAKHRAGLFDEAALEFGRWNRAGGRVMAGLSRRRAAEAKLYREGSQ